MSTGTSTGGSPRNARVTLILPTMWALRSVARSSHLADVTWLNRVKARNAPQLCVLSEDALNIHDEQLTISPGLWPFASLSPIYGLVCSSSRLAILRYMPLMR